jgi:hypothetical protein
MICTQFQFVIFSTSLNWHLSLKTQNHFLGSALIDVFSQHKLEAVALHHSHLHFDYADLFILITGEKEN